ncbi:MAG: tetratricopeptide repeat protein [Planctomycetota bacterium]|nr:tetratricopeptide repeat protein [Planctomycetota bacterium]
MKETLTRTSILVLTLGALAACSTTNEEVEAVPEAVVAIAPEALDEMLQEADAVFQLGDWEAAAEAYREITAVDPGNALAWHHLGYALHADGELESALEAHERAAGCGGDFGAVGAYNAACVYSLWEKSDLAFEWLERSLEAGFVNLDALDNDPDFDNIRDDPRFEQLFALAEEKADSYEAQPR